MEFEDVVSTFKSRFTVIDNNILFTISHMMGARAFEVHLATYWPEWGVRLIDNLEKGAYLQVQRDVVNQVKPFYKLWMEIEKDYTAGDGYLNKLCMELVGLDSSRCRPPTRDVRDRYRERARDMLIADGRATGGASEALVPFSDRGAGPGGLPAFEERSSGDCVNA